MFVFAYRKDWWLTAPVVYMQMYSIADSLWDFLAILQGYDVV